MKFETTPEEDKQIDEWVKAQHAKHINDEFGSLITYSFTNTGIGTAIEVEYFGEKFNPTDYSEW